MPNAERKVYNFPAKSGNLDDCRMGLEGNKMSKLLAMSQWKNNIFSKLPINKGDGYLLVEPVGSLLVLHHLCLYSVIICRARGLTPRFTVEAQSEEKYRKIISFYFDKFEIFVTQDISKLKRFELLVYSALYFCKFNLTKNILPTCFRKFHIGPIIYDAYLMMNSVATMHYTDIQLIRSIYHTLRSIEWGRVNIEKINPKAILISHRVGVRAGGLLSIAKACGINIFSIGGQDYGTLYLEKDSHLMHYEFTATMAELEPILTLPENDFQALYDKIREKHFQGSFNADAKLAFSKKLFTSREEFCTHYKIESTKKNVFIMLHAFTDYPHSHFNGMLFEDYFDWFLQTLKFASLETNVNWIIKQHPSAHFYPIKDVVINDIIEKYKKPHIVFLDSHENIDTRSIAHVGDALITCIGSAGFELSAIGGVPSITAGDNPYADAGFAIYPKSKTEYFSVLNHLDKLQKLDEKARKNAIATYLFIHRLSRVRMIFIPEISHQEHRDLAQSMDYFKKVEDNITSFGAEKVIHDLTKYIQSVQRSDFHALRTDPKECEI